jgi:CRP-like cAMP-binding protein
VICTLSRTDVQRLILAYPQFALRLIETIGKGMVQAERRLEALAFKTVVPRLADFLQHESRGGLIEELSHQEIGERLGGPTRRGEHGEQPSLLPVPSAARRCGWCR